MTSYKPGQVSASLFTGKGKVTNKDENLAKLFSSSKPLMPVPKTTLLPSNQILPASESTGNGESTAKSKHKNKKRKKKQPKVDDSGKQGHKENREKPGASSTPLVNADQTLVQQRQADVSPGKSLKRKLEKDGTNDSEELIKRARRDRKRDKQADSRTVFVGNCPLTADKKKLKQLFREFGEIEAVRFRCAPSADPNLPKRATVITKNFHEQCDNFISYVVFKEEKAAKKALVRNGHLLDGLHLRVDLAGMAKKHDKKRSVFVGNLPFTVSEEVIRSHFSDCGEITNVRIIRDRLTNLGKGICYVQFESKDSVGLAMKLHKSAVLGREIRVMVCVNKPKKKEDQTAKKRRSTDNAEKPVAKKIAFAPSNVTSSKFQAVLKVKREKRFRKMKKKKENSKKQDGLSSIFGDLPAANKKVKFGKVKKDNAGKHSSKSSETKKSPLHKGNSFKGKGNSFKGKGNSFKGKGNSFKGKGKGKSNKTKH
ncbi:hypothetical protein BsWGS_24412 [Bradybaena similaris]